MRKPCYIEQLNAFYVLLRAENCTEFLSEHSTCWLAIITHFVEGRGRKKWQKFKFFSKMFWLFILHASVKQVRFHFHYLFPSFLFLFFIVPYFLFFFHVSVLTFLPYINLLHLFPFFAVFFFLAILKIFSSAAI